MLIWLMIIPMLPKIDLAALAALSEGWVRPTPGRTLAVLLVSGGSQSFNAVNAMRRLGRWMRSVTIANQSSRPKADGMS